MTNREKHNPNSQGYTNALLEDIDDKFQAVIEATAPIPAMQEQISRIAKWENDINLIPAIFEEVGALRKEVEVIKEATKLLDRHDKRLDKIEQRLSVVEQRIN